MSFWQSLKKISLKKIVTGVETAAKGALGAISGGQGAVGGTTTVIVPGSNPQAFNLDTKTILLIGGGLVVLFLLMKR